MFVLSIVEHIPAARVDHRLTLRQVADRIRDVQIQTAPVSSASNSVAWDTRPRHEAIAVKKWGESRRAGGPDESEQLSNRRSDDLLPGPALGQEFAAARTGGRPFEDG
jgi:hypothetical protein